MSPATAAEALSRTSTAYWDFLMRSNPVWATYLGDRRYEAELPRIDTSARGEAAAAFRGFLAELATIPRGELGESDRLTAEVLEIEAERRLGEIEHRFHEWRVDQLEGPQVAIFELANYHPMDAAGRATFLARVGKLAAFVDEYVSNLRDGLRSGNVAHEGSVRRVAAQLRDTVRSAHEKCPLLDAVERVPAEVTRDERDAFRGALLELVSRVVKPALAGLLEFLEREYGPKARSLPGVSANPGGADAYRYRLRAYTTLPLDAADVHAMGLETMSLLQVEMQGIARRLHGDGDTAGFNDALRRDQRHFYSTRDELREDAERLLERAKAALPRLVGRLPRADCVVKPTEPFREKDAPGAYYYPPPEDGSRPGIYFINTHRPEARARYCMPALTLHEAVPGHHLQIALATELAGVPQFRRHAEVTAYVEGWALYSELLGEELGLYEDDLMRYGMLTYQAWRAARLVVDTGLHAMGWSRERAIGYFRENLALSEEEIENEIDRYIVWPGQALAYMVGCIELKKLRREAESTLGAKFDQRAFHDEVLRHGAVPLPVLRRVIESWVRRSAGRPS